MGKLESYEPCHVSLGKMTHAAKGAYPWARSHYCCDQPQLLLHIKGMVCCKKIVCTSGFACMYGARICACLRR